MSEIEKMYENCEIKKQIPKIYSNNELYCKECEAHIEDAMPYCQNAKYPPFTAEKQIELIKWLCKNKVDSIVVSCNDYGRYERWEILCNFSFALSDDFENVLCAFVNTF